MSLLEKITDLISQVENAADEKEVDESEVKEEKIENEKEEIKEEEKEEEVKNEEEKEEETEEEEEAKEVENKKSCKNSMDEIKNLVMGGSSKVENKLYVSKAERLEMGNKY